MSLMRMTLKERIGDWLRAMVAVALVVVLFLPSLVIRLADRLTLRAARKRAGLE